MKFATLEQRYTNNTTSVIIEIDGAGKRREMSFAELGEHASKRASQLRGAGIEPGDVIGIRAKNSIEWVAWDLAALSVGAVLQAFPDEAEVSHVEGLALLVTDELAETAKRAGAQPVTDKDVHSRVYSSGTTGKLKGLQISKTGTEYVIGRFLDSYTITAADRHLIFLPLANYQQRLSVYCCLWTGADLVLAPYQRVFAALKSESPTFIIAPPVFYDATLQLFAKTGAGQSLTGFLGGKLRFAITGMAPIRRPTQEAFWSAGVKLLEAYGLTECGMIAWNTEESYRLGSVGRLIDPESVEFTADGELIIRRAAPLSRGYFEADADTAGDTFRPDGTIATGDFGVLDADGFLTLLGRKKDAIVLNNGRKVNPAEIEAVLSKAEGALEVVVSTTEAGRLAAIVTPADSANETELRQRILQANEGLEAHQRISLVVFRERPMQADRQFLTANMKLSRRAVAEYFAEVHGGR